jgi:hypothetical protein
MALCYTNAQAVRETGEGPIEHLSNSTNPLED